MKSSYNNLSITEPIDVSPPSATYAKKLTALSIAQKQKEKQIGFSLWLDEHKQDLHEKIIKACGQGKDSIIYQHVPADYYSLFEKYFFNLGYTTEKQSTYINGEDTEYSVYIFWRY